jgi:hypothetical protein
MLISVKKYELFGDTSKVMTEISKFEENIQHIHKRLRHLLDVVMTGNGKHIKEIQKIFF